MGGGEVYADGARGPVGGQGFGKAVAELGDCFAEGRQPGEDGHAGEVEGVAGGVEVAFEGGGIFAAEGDAGWDEEQTGAGWWGGRRITAAAGGRSGRGRRHVLEDDVAEGQGGETGLVALKG